MVGISMRVGWLAVSLLRLGFAANGGACSTDDVVVADVAAPVVVDSVVDVDTVEVVAVACGVATASAAIEDGRPQPTRLTAHPAIANARNDLRFIRHLHKNE